VKQVERQTHRLAVRGDKVERVEPAVVWLVEHAGHHAVYGERGHREVLPLPRGIHDLGGGGLVVDRVDEDAEDVALPLGDHAGIHLSTLASYISCRIIGTS
jgi:hypothetical protein